jgi:predicted GNAT family N-acyltransferase
MEPGPSLSGASASPHPSGVSGRLILEWISPESPLFAHVLRLRRRVFVDEQGIPPEIEIDKLDATAVHLAGYVPETSVAPDILGTLRLIIDGAQGRIGRMAVRDDTRRCGVGTRLMAEAVNHAVKAGCSVITLAAQTNAQGFYETLGFQVTSATFLEAGIPHINMERLV